MWCKSCRVTGYTHCAHPDECGNMVTLTAAADSWKSWLDDAPLPETFNSATGGLQDFITALSRALLDARAELARVKADAAAAQALVIINLESDLLDRVLEGSVWSMPEGTHTTDEWGRGVTDARRDIAAAVRATFADIADNDGLAMVSEPHDPGDGWTWNERLGWIGPDGKPADPRMRG